MMSPLIRDLYNYNIRVVCAGNVKIENRVQSVKIILMVVLGTMFVDEIFFCFNSFTVSRYNLYSLYMYFHMLVSYN